MRRWRSCGRTRTSVKVTGEVGGARVPGNESGDLRCSIDLDQTVIPRRKPCYALLHQRMKHGHDAQHLAGCGMIEVTTEVKLIAEQRQRGLDIAAKEKFCAEHRRAGVRRGAGSETVGGHS